MIDKCLSCGRKFNWLRKNHYCKLCGEEFCNDCISPTMVSVGIYSNKHITIQEEPRFELVAKKSKIEYKIMNQNDFSKSMSLCKRCKHRIEIKSDEFRSEIIKKLDSIFVTNENYIKGYNIVRKLGFLEYNSTVPRTSRLYNPSNLSNFAIVQLKIGAIQHEANALVKFQQTNIRTPIHFTPVKAKASWEDFIPGYGNPKHQGFQQPSYVEVPVFQAEAVFVQKA